MEFSYSALDDSVTTDSAVLKSDIEISLLFNLSGDEKTGGFFRPTNLGERGGVVTEQRAGGLNYLPGLCKFIECIIHCSALC
jgi:hypothetical protein